MNNKKTFKELHEEYNIVSRLIESKTVKKLGKRIRGKLIKEVIW